jgi:hypothetical protein
MKRLTLCLIFLLGANAQADLTVDGTSTPGLDGGADRFTMYLMDEQLRVDRVVTKMIDGAGFDTVESSILVRFTGAPAGILFLDHGARTVKVVAAMEPAPDDPSGSASPIRITRTDETREILGQVARRFDFSFGGSIDPMVMVGQQVPPQLADMLKINLAVTGSSWVAPGMQGAQEFAGFMQMMADYQMIIGQAVAGQPVGGSTAGLISAELSSGLKEVMAQLSQHGLPVHTTTNSNMSVALEGQMAVMMQGMLDSLGIGGNYPSETIATRVDSAPVDAALFYDGGVPDGYTVSYLE